MTPDFETLKKISAELDDLEQRRALTKPDFERLLADARAAVNGRTEYLESVLMTGLDHGFISPG